MKSPNPAPQEAFKQPSVGQLFINPLSVNRYYRWVQQQSETDQDLSELIEGKVSPLPSSIERMRMLRLLQWQLQHFLELPSIVSAERSTAEESCFEVHLKPSVQLNKFSLLKPAILVSKGNVKDSGTEELLESNRVWVIDIGDRLEEQPRARLYAQSNIPNYWSFDCNSAELNLYQQPSASSYQSHRVLQVGDRASPLSVPITVTLQESGPLHFMTRTLKGQQTYKSNALPFSFSRP